MTRDLQPGVEVCRGKFRVVRLLGTGGFGRVFEAENTATRRRIALKTLHPDNVNDELLDRLRREAIVASRVRHRHLVDVYDFERDDDSVFLIMERLEGESLRQAMDRGRMPIAEVLALLLPVMRGLAALHKHGVVHRDVKPENILLAREYDTPEPVPKLFDFGISKVEDESLQLPALTHGGRQGMGSILYMSPEQYADSKNVDCRTDIYAVGVMLYECLTGQAPYGASDSSKLMLEILTKTPPSPRELCPEIPAPLEAIVCRAMAKDAGERYQSIDELAAELRPFASMSANESKPIEPWPKAAAPEPAVARRLSARAVRLCMSMLLLIVVAQTAVLCWQAQAPWWPGSRSPESSNQRRTLTPLQLSGSTALALNLLPRRARLRKAAPALADLPPPEPEAREEQAAPAPEPVRPAAAAAATSERSQAAPAAAPGQLTAAQLSRVVDAGRSGLQSCYEAAMRETGAEEHTNLNVDIEVAPAGQVASVQTSGATLAGLDACITRLVRTWQFPAAAAATQARFPIAFASKPAGVLTAAQLSAVVLKGKAGLQRCYESEERGSLEPLRLDVDLQVSPAGYVIDVHTSGKQASLEACVVRTIRSWRFPASSDPTRTRFPLVFQPGA